MTPDDEGSEKVSGVTDKAAPGSAFNVIQLHNVREQPNFCKMSEINFRSIRGETVGSRTWPTVSVASVESTIRIASCWVAPNAFLPANRKGRLAAAQFSVVPLRCIR